MGGVIGGWCYCSGKAAANNLCDVTYLETKVSPHS